MKRRLQNIMKKCIISCWEENQTSILPNALLKYYKKMSLNEQEVMFLLEIAHFQKIDGNSFPGIDELKERMTISSTQIMTIIQRLVTCGYLKIQERYDESTDIHYEKYDIQPLYDHLSDLWMKEEGWMQKLEAVLEQELPRELAHDDSMVSSLELLKGLEGSDIFTIFQKEFGRPLSPIECERIVKWIDEDKFSKELILEALKQAVLINKFSMAYIDRILYEWKRKNIRTKHEAEQANIEFLEKKNQRTGKTKNQGQPGGKSANQQQDKELWYWLNIESQEGR